MNLAEKLKHTRKESAMTLAFVAEKLGVNLRTITRYENGSILPPLDKLEALAKLYSVPVTYFVADSDSSNSVLQWINALSKQELQELSAHISKLLKEK